ncbi:MAG: 50S ribosomal protein L11 methyltransferase [Loktanella sp.]|jgi:ribosomal protein L11 methyltransferase|nr:50S ribosomal protein L11 methyltransferase [Loktanella sp.]MDO7607516.1 50S ribosomal protein L11 methyltransferase [Loktanella sp.]MDO7622572.1 50S ribosomal protein L11 methyltransferase [Loktanella sp.]MDO7626233.1 50S ribosomal protein L11 methyltransferase [Loktanella sp.]MDO7665912.1 50S ribosomal protein L11 methyltransferase [Loktanella sp.]
MLSYSALTVAANEDIAAALCEDLEALMPEPTGTGIFEVEDGSGLWEVGAYFTEAPDAAGLAILASMHGVKDFLISEIPETDWVSHVRRELAPVEAGRFFVYGSHDADKVPAGRVPLLIEAAMAFGTGHHGTTLGCLRAFDRLLGEGFKGGSIIDVGCGTAVLAMAAAAVLPSKVLASDIDPVAVDVAEANVAANGLTGKVECVVAAGFDAPALKENAPYDLIFANILKGPLIGLAPEMGPAVKTGGYVILSGILNEQADAVIDVYCANGFNLVQRDSIVDWTTLTLSKMP